MGEGPEEETEFLVELLVSTFHLDKTTITTTTLFNSFPALSF